MRIQETKIVFFRKKRRSEFLKIFISQATDLHLRVKETRIYFSIRGTIENPI